MGKNMIITINHYLLKANLDTFVKQVRTIFGKNNFATRAGWHLSRRYTRTGC